MNKIFIVFLLITTAIGCKTNTEKATAVTPVETPAADGSAEPFLFTDQNGTTYLSWIEKHGEKSEFRFSRLMDGKWSASMLIDSGSTWFVNWADYPMIATNGNQFVAHYLDKSGDGTYAYDVKLTSSSDGGSSWSKATVLHDDGKRAEHGFVSILPYDQNFFVAWLDGRNTAMEGMEHHEGHHGQMSLRAAVIDKEGKKLNEWELDNRTCDCCQTSAALTDNGPIVVYRDRSDDEIRDMSIVRFVNGAWTTPKPVYEDKWKIAGCPVNGPRVVANGNKVAVAWFSVPDNTSQVNVTFSDDGGKTFEKPIRVDEGKAVGRVDIVMLDDRSVYVIWMEGSTIKGAHVTKSGKQSSMTIASSSEARSGGFPQLTRSGNQLIFAWTDDSEKTIKTAIVSL